MTCRELADFLADYLSGELSPETRSAFERHLSLCHDCTAYLSNYRQAIDLGRQVCASDDDVLPADVPQDLIDAILASRRK